LTWPPPKRKPHFSIAIPASYTSDLPHLRDKTVRAGVIGRAAAVFRVDRIVIYLDRHGVESEGEFLCQVLRFLDAPQYLRKRLFKLSPLLKYAGLLPPLRAPHHAVERDVEKMGRSSFREGIVVKSGRRGSLVDIGLDKLFPLSRTLPVGSRITVRVVKRRGGVSVKLASREEVGVYWGFEVEFTGKGLRRTISDLDADLIIATSKYGSHIHRVAEKLAERLSISSSVLVLFGSPHEGLFSIARREGFRLEEVSDFILNTIPLQGTETVRTEEAVIATLSILNVLPSLCRSG